MQRKFFYVTGLLALVVFSYYFCYPNDFFLSKKPFVSQPSQYEVKKNFFSFSICNRSALTDEVKAFIASPESHFQNHPSGLIKDNDKRTILKTKLGHQSVILKRYNYRNFYDWITKCPFRSSKAYRSWYYMHALKEAGVPTTTPVAIVEKRIGPLWLKTYLVIDYFKGKTLAESFNQLSEREARQISKKLHQTIQTFKRKKWLHRDFIAKNILIGQDTIAVIDVDEMHSYVFSNWIFANKCRQKHLGKFTRTIPPTSQFKHFFDDI